MKGQTAQGVNGQPKFTARHFEAIASILGSFTPISPRLAAHFADHFAEDNPRFDRAKFHEAVRVAATARRDAEDRLIALRGSGGDV